MCKELIVLMNLQLSPTPLFFPFLQHVILLFWLSVIAQLAYVHKQRSTESEYRIYIIQMVTNNSKGMLMFLPLWLFVRVSHDKNNMMKVPSNVKSIVQHLWNWAFFVKNLK